MVQQPWRAVKGKNNLLCFQLSADCNFVPGVVHSLWHHIVFVFFQNSNFQQIGPRTILPYVIDTYCYSSILQIYTVSDEKNPFWNISFSLLTFQKSVLFVLFFLALSSIKFFNFWTRRTCMMKFSENDVLMKDLQMIRHICIYLKCTFWVLQWKGN